MTIRDIRPEDLPTLRDFHQKTGFGYSFPEFGTNFETAKVAIGRDGQIMGGVATERIVQAYLWLAPMSPEAKLNVIRELHEATAAELKALGYNEANCFLPPTIADRFGRRLERCFHWVKNWPSWAVKL
jgi:hypothetical protein